MKRARGVIVGAVALAAIVLTIILIPKQGDVKPTPAEETTVYEAASDEKTPPTITPVTPNETSVPSVQSETPREDLPPENTPEEGEDDDQEDAPSVIENYVIDLEDDESFVIN